MKLRFALSGSIIFETDADCVPAAGDRVEFVTQNYKKGIVEGTLVSATVTGDGVIPRTFDFTASEVAVTLDVDEIIEHGKA